MTEVISDVRHDDLFSLIRRAVAELQPVQDLEDE